MELNEMPVLRPVPIRNKEQKLFYQDISLDYNSQRMESKRGLVLCPTG